MTGRRGKPRPHAVVVAVGLVAAVVFPYLALGGGRYEPTPVADPCEERERAGADGLGETIERIALRAVDGVACELEVAREDLVLALRSEEALDAFAREQTKMVIFKIASKRARDGGVAVPSATKGFRQRLKLRSAAMRVGCTSKRSRQEVQ